MKTIIISLAAVAALSTAALAEPSRAFDSIQAQRDGLYSAATTTDTLAVTHSSNMVSNFDRVMWISGQTGSNSHH